MESVLDVLGDTNVFEQRVTTGVITAAGPDVATVVTRDGDIASLPSGEFYEGQPFEVGRSYLMLLGGDPLHATVTDPDLVTAVYAGVTPELRTGTVRIISVARAAGQRTKIAVAATTETVDPVSALVGRDANRVRTVSAMLGGERIDVIQYHPYPVAYLIRALAPATVSRVEIAGQVATVFAPPHQMSAAVGHGGLNAQLAGKLLGLIVRVEVDTSQH
jgi:N utilization substance protein A